MGKLFYNTAPITEKEYVRGRRLFILSECFFSFAAAVLLGQYLTALLLNRGVSESQITFIFGMPQILLLVSLAVPYITRKMKYRKAFFMSVRWIEALPVAILFFGPILGVKAGFFPAAAVCYALYVTSAYLSNPLYQEWLLALAPKDHAAQASYFGKKQTAASIFNLSGLMIVMFLGKRYETENPELFFTVIAVIGVITTTVKTVLQLLIREIPQETVEEAPNPFRAIKEIFSDKRFRPFLTFSVLYACATATYGAIANVYQQNRLGISPSDLTLIGIVSMLIYVPCSFVWGKIAGKIGYRVSLGVNLGFLTVSYAMLIFATPSVPMPFVITSYVTGSIANAGIGVAQNAFMFQCTLPEKRTLFFSFYNVIVSLITYPLTLLIAAVVNAFGPDKSFVFLGKTWNEMHFIFLAAVLLGAACTLLLLFSKKKTSE